MHAQLALFALTILAGASPSFPHAEALGAAQQASLNQVDILVAMAYSLPPAMQAQASKAVSLAQRAHERAVRSLIVVERGVVTADYRRWKLRRAIRTLIRADRKRHEFMERFIGEAPEQFASLLTVANRKAHAESSRAVGALRDLEKKMTGGTAGAGISGARVTHAGVKGRGHRNSEDSKPTLPVGGPHSCR
ncbi:MAG: hypothetical protein V3U98_01425 [Acidobacteriota bacterium]